MLKYSIIFLFLIWDLLVCQNYEFHSKTIYINNMRIDQNVRTNNIKIVDFANYTYQLDGYQYTLKDSIYRQMDDYCGIEVGFDSVCYWGKYTIVSLYEIDMGGSSTSESYLQLYTVENDRLMLLSEITYNGYSTIIDNKNKSILIKSKLWLDEDPNCCPSKLEVAHIIIDQDGFIISDLNLEVYKH